MIPLFLDHFKMGQDGGIELLKVFEMLRENRLQYFNIKVLVVVNGDVCS